MTKIKAVGGRSLRGDNPLPHDHAGFIFTETASTSGSEILTCAMAYCDVRSSALVRGTSEPVVRVKAISTEALIGLEQIRA
jgi:hypothetical protein